MDPTTLGLIGLVWIAIIGLATLAMVGSLIAMTRRVEASARSNTRLVDAWGITACPGATVTFTLFWKVDGLLPRPYPRIDISLTHTSQGAPSLKHDPWVDALKRRIEGDMRHRSGGLAMLTAVCRTVSILMLVDRPERAYTLFSGALTRRIPNASGHEKLAAQRYLRDTLAPRPGGDVCDAAPARATTRPA